MTPAERLARLESFLRLDPTNERLRQDAILAAIHAAETARARELLGPPAADESPAHGHLRATLLLAERDYAAAAAAFQALREAGAEDSGLLFNLGYASLYAGDPVAAAAALAPVVSREDAPPSTLVWLLRALHRTSRLDAAIDAWSGALLPQRTPDAEGVASLVFFDAGKGDEARRLAQDALAHGTGVVEALVVSGTLAVADGDASLADRLLGQAAERAPTDGRVRSSIGIALMARGDLAAAEEAFRQSVAALPQHLGTWHALAWCQILARRPADARASLDAAMALDRNFGETHGALAVVDALEGARELASQGIERARRLGPQGMAWRYAEAVLDGRAADAQAVGAIARSVLGANPPRAPGDVH